MSEAPRREKPADILLVEDNTADIRLTQEAFREGRVPGRLSFARDGEAALAFLRHEGAYQGAPRPDLILLDLNLPRMDGRQLLAAIKGDPTLRLIPVIVLTTSNADQDIERAFELHANCYVIKPVTLERFVTVVRSIGDFWMNVTVLPHHRSARPGPDGLAGA